MSNVLASTTSMGRKYTLLEILEAYESAGFEAVELGTAHSPDQVDVPSIKKFDFEYSVHNFFPLSDTNHLLNIASSDRKSLDMTLKVALGAVDICHQVSGSFYGMHAGFRSDVTASTLGVPLEYSAITSYEEAHAIMVDTIQRVCDHARPMGIEVLVENHVLAPFNLVNGRNELLLMCDRDEAVRMCKDVDRSNFGVLVDLGHLRVTCQTLQTDPIAFIDAVGPWLKGFHLSENDGTSDQTLPFDESVWFGPVLKNITNVPWVIESNVADVQEMSRLVDLVSAWRN